MSIRGTFIFPFQISFVNGGENGGTDGDDSSSMMTVFGLVKRDTNKNHFELQHQTITWENSIFLTCQREFLVNYIEPLFPDLLIHLVTTTSADNCEDEQYKTINGNFVNYIVNGKECLPQWPLWRIDTISFKDYTEVLSYLRRNVTYRTDFHLIDVDSHQRLYFEMWLRKKLKISLGTWFYTTLSDIRNATPDEIKLEQLPSNPFDDAFALVSWDIEVVCDSLSEFPKGFTSKEKISSVCVSVEYRGNFAVFLLVLVPKNFTPSKEWTTKFIEYFRTLDEGKSEPMIFLDWFFDEYELIMNLVGRILHGKFVATLSKSSTTPAIYLGYNTHNFDFNYLAARLFFYRKKSPHTIMIIESIYDFFHSSHQKCFSLDLFEVIQSKYHNTLNSFKLNYVANHFLKESKADMDSVQIRHLYYDFGKQSSDLFNFYKESSNGVPTLAYILYYNIIDCLLLHKLTRAIHALEYVLFYQENFCCDGFRALTGGQTYLMSKGIEKFFFDQKYLVKPNMNPVTFWEENIRDLEDVHTKVINYEKRLAEALALSISNRTANTEDTMKKYKGATNGAISGIWRNVKSGDFAAMYPSASIAHLLSIENIMYMYVSEIVAVLDRLKMFSRSLTFKVYNDENVLQSILLGIENFQEVTLDEIPKLDADTLIMIIVKFKYTPLKELFKFFLEQRQKYKRSKEKSTELLWKTAANSLYGYLGAERAQYRSYAAAASITWHCRELTYLVCKYSQDLYDSLPIYIDTDGVMTYVPANRNVSSKQFCESITRAINREHIIFEEEGDVPLCIVIGKKKYVRFDTKSTFVLKGMEKNAPIVIKNIFRSLCSAVWRASTLHNYEVYYNRPDRNSLWISIFNYVLDRDPKDLYVQIVISSTRKPLLYQEFVTNALKIGEEEGAKCQVLVVHMKSNVIDLSQVKVVTVQDFDSEQHIISCYHFIANYLQYMWQLVCGDSETIPKSSWIEPFAYVLKNRRLVERVLYYGKEVNEITEPDKQYLNLFNPTEPAIIDFRPCPITGNFLTRAKL